MNSRRGKFLRSLEEDCEIRRERVQRRPNDTEFEVVEPAQKVIILNASSTVGLREIIDLDNSYTGNIRPPNPNIQIADELVRSSGQILTVTKTTTILDVQRLELEDRDKVVA